MTARRLAPPSTIIENAESFWVQDAGGQTVGWFYTGCISDCSHVGVCWLACGPRGRWHGTVIQIPADPSWPVPALR
jgi:hypothetical protein